MKKVLSVLLLGILIFSLLTGCQPANFPEGFSKAKAEEIARHWLEENPYFTFPWYHIDGFGCYYLGHDNGYDIFYYDREQSLVTTGDPISEEELRNIYTLRIGDTVFYPCRDKDLQVYKDGEFLTLTKAYTQGLVSSETVAAAGKTLDAYFQTILASDPWKIAEAQWKYCSNFFAGNEHVLKMIQEGMELDAELGRCPYIDWYKSMFEYLS